MNFRRQGIGGRVWGVAVLLGLSLFFNTGSAENEVELLADWTLFGVDGAPVNFYEDSANRPAVLLFWATWCPYCRHLMPHLEKLRQEFAPAVRFYALNIWEDGDPVAHLADNGYGFHLLLEADAVAKGYGITGTPGLIVVDGNRGVIYMRKSGTSPGQVETDLRAALAKRVNRKE